MPNNSNLLAHILGLIRSIANDENATAKDLMEACSALIESLAITGAMISLGREADRLTDKGFSQMCENRTRKLSARLHQTFQQSISEMIPE